MSKTNKVLIIAEAGVNHNGSFDKAIEMIKVAKESGADAIKFQTAVPELVMTSDAKKAQYQINSEYDNETQLEMIKRIHLPLDSYHELKKECNKYDIEFMSTAFDDVSLKTLRRLSLKRYKIPSGEITNLPYLREIGRIGKPLIMSTGMANMGEIKFALRALLDAGAKKKNITILHCNTDYPTIVKDVNLQAMISIHNEFKVNVGYSDHTLGIEIPIAAVGMGASVIEKHFTLDRKLIGPDHSASLEPNEFSLMVKYIRNIEVAIGDGIKRPSKSEIKNIPIVRKSIVAKRAIKKGEIFSNNNITVKRPGTGISPIEWDVYIGKIANKNYQMDELIK